MDWDSLASWADKPATFEYNMEQRRKVQATLAALAQAATAAAASRNASVAPPSEPVVAAPAARDPVTVLETALAAAADDAERAKLLAGAPPKVREQLKARLCYVKFIRDSKATVDAQYAAYAEFSARLDAAQDDAARLAIIRSADPAFVAKWHAHRVDTPEAARRRYLAMAAGDGNGVDAV